MYKTLLTQLQGRLAEVIKERYGLELPAFAVELPPRIELGEMALTVALQLARPLKRPPAPRAVRDAPACPSLPS